MWTSVMAHSLNEKDTVHDSTLPIYQIGPTGPAGPPGPVGPTGPAGELSFPIGGRTTITVNPEITSITYVLHNVDGYETIPYAKISDEPFSNITSGTIIEPTSEIKYFNFSLTLEVIDENYYRYHIDDEKAAFPNLGLIEVYTADYPKGDNRTILESEKDFIEKGTYVFFTRNDSAPKGSYLHSFLCGQESVIYDKEIMKDVTIATKEYVDNKIVAITKEDYENGTWEAPEGAIVVVLEEATK